MNASFDPNRHRRRSIRLRGYDYSRIGVYFVTLCTHNREPLLGEIVGARFPRPGLSRPETYHPHMILNEFGEIVLHFWNDIPNHFPQIELDEFIIMPNHFHGIIIVGAGSPRPGSPHPNGMMNGNGEDGRDDRAPTTLGKIVAYFKYQSTKQINALRNEECQKLWQRNYYERIIRDDDELNRIREYVGANPANWDQDGENPVRIIL